MADEKNNSKASDVQALADTIAELQQKVKDIEAANVARSVQQLQYPLDFVSQQILAGLFSVPGPRSFSLGGNKGFGIYYGDGSPNGVIQAGQGSLYLNFTGSSTSTRAYINTDGATAWTNVVTAT